MKVPWSGSRCIICLNVGSLCDEHIIPQALGGRITSKFLCSSCNSKLGHDLEHSAKSDPSVLIAAKHLSTKIPHLANSLLQSHPHLGHSEQGTFRGNFKNGKFQVRSHLAGDSSIIQPTDDAIKTISTILRRSGYEEAPIKKAIKYLRKAPENKRIRVAPNLEVIKWRIDNLETDLSKAQIMHPLIPAKIAFEFLACHAGQAIYNESPQLSDVRQTLYSMDLKQTSIKVDRLSSNKYEPFHGICFEGNNPHAMVQIRLFGWLAFRVHFLRLSISGPRFVYTHRLENGYERVDIIKRKNTKNQYDF